MKPTTLTSMAFVAATQVLGALAATPTKGATPTQIPSVVPIPNQLTSHGCYSSGANLTEQSGVSSVSSGKCYDTCRDAAYYVSALKGSKCYCGMVYPPTKDLSDDSACNYPCPGYSIEACGSIEDGGHWSVFNTGIEVDVSEYEPEVSSTAAPSSTQPSTETSAAATTTATETGIPGESGDGEKKKSGPNVAGIAAGVVVGVVVMGAGIGSLFFVVRRKRNAEIEEEHRRNAAVNAFINGSKPPGSAGSISMTDSRLDPVMAHRRLSDGSIADNQDYSRRILRVTNA